MDAMDAMRTRITKESEIVRKVQMMAEQIQMEPRKDLTMVEPTQRDSN